MPEITELTELKQQIENTIKRYSDRGFVPYNGCLYVCRDMEAILDISQQHLYDDELKEGFDIAIMVLIEVVRMISHADDSAGGVSDVVCKSMNILDQICKKEDAVSDECYLKELLKASKNKVFDGWDDWAYDLLKLAAALVKNEKQAKLIYDVSSIYNANFEKMNELYGKNPNRKNVDEYLIRLKITEKLEGTESANAFLDANLDIEEFRRIAVEKAILSKNYIKAEALCLEASKEQKTKRYHRGNEWLYFLERIYRETYQDDRVLLTVKKILLQGDTSYFDTLKETYIDRGEWEKVREPLWRELEASISLQDYTGLLSRENEIDMLMAAIKKCPSNVVYYAKQLFPKHAEEVSNLFEGYILEEAESANSRYYYRQVCALIKKYALSGASIKAMILIDELANTYPRRPAMLDELSKLRMRLSKR